MLCFFSGKFAAKNVINRSAYLGVQLGRVDRGEVQMVDDGFEPSAFSSVFESYALLVPSSKSSTASMTLSDEPPSQHILYRVQGRVDIAAKGDRIDFRQLSNKFAFILDTTDRFVWIGSFLFLFLFCLVRSLVDLRRLFYCSVFLWIGNNATAADRQLAHQRADVSLCLCVFFCFYSDKNHQK